uniref:Protein phosphatase 2A beta subunit mRNA n=2 Tax=Boreoeutheria TaxID=1437010 RepID=A2NAY3_HUMAN|nr:upstream ORF 1 [Homo sapiens]
MVQSHWLPCPPLL